MEVATTENGATGLQAGEAVFAPLTFTSTDLIGAERGSDGIMKKTLKYRVTEKAGAVSNGSSNGIYGYSSEVYMVYVDVIDNGSGKLSTNVTYKKVNGAVEENSAPPVFTNNYTPNKVTWDLDAELTNNSKAVVYPDGMAVPTYDLTKFSFAVTDALGNELSTGTTAADGTVTFDPVLTFTEAREYHFWIAEKTFTDDTITFDKRHWEVHVVVGYDAATGALKDPVAKVYPISRAAETVDGIDFVNTYEPTATTLVLTVDKTLTGREMLPGEFHFQLVEGDRIVTEAVNGAPDQNGKATVTFHVNYTYADLGEHTYKIVEVNAGKGGVTYDATEREIVVKVEDENGQLKAYVTNAAGSAPVVFANTYATAPVDVPINAFKHLTGKALTDGAYTFELVDAVGQIVTAKNDADGKIEFTKTFTAATEQPVVYTLREKNDAQSGVTYDKAEYKVTISVIDDLHGRLIPVVTYTTADGQPTDYDIPVFINSYDAASVDVTLSAEKELKGRGMKDGEFLFKVYDSFGTLISEGKNEKDGDVIFTPITFGELGKYTLRVVEVDTGDKDITYDDSEFTVTVLVTDDGKGQLQAKVTYPDGGVTFTNKWQSQTAPNTGDTFNAPLMVGMLVFSAAVLVLLLFLNKRKKEDTAE